MTTAVHAVAPAVATRRTGWEMLRAYRDLQMTCVLLGRVFKVDPWTEPGRFQVGTGGSVARRLTVGRRVTLALYDEACASGYVAVYVTAVVRRVDREGAHRAVDVVAPNGTRHALALRPTDVASLEPLAWTFDEIVGTTAHDPRVREGNVNVQLRRRFGKKAYEGKEYLIFACKDDVPKAQIFTHQCKRFRAA
jgi:hypothetical protein